MVTSNYMRNPAQSKEMATGSFHLFIHLCSTWLFFCLEWLCYNLAHDFPGTMKHWEGAWLDLCRGQWIWSGDFLFSFNNFVYPARPFPACCEVIPKFQKLKNNLKLRFLFNVQKKKCCLIIISSCQWTAQPSCTLLIISPKTDSWCTEMKPDHVDATVNSFVPAKTTRWRQSWYFLNRIRIRIVFIEQVYAQTHTRNLFPVDGVSTGSQQ